MVPESIRRDMNNIELSIADEVFLMRLFGRSMYGIKGIRAQRTWKKILVRTCNVLRMAVGKSLESDGFHKLKLDTYIKKFETACKSKDIIDIKIILLLTGMVLELLGHLPDYSQRRALNRHSDYCLNTLRSLRYTQTPYQKMRTIIEAARYKPFCDYHKHDDLYDEYVRKYNGNSAGFVEWYKNEYPSVYVKIF